MKVRVIGGNPAGLSAASAVRKAHPDWDIIVYERSQFISYASCGIPYYIEEKVAKIDKLITITKDRFLTERNIPVLTQHEVVAVNFSKKEITVRNLISNEERIESYDKLMISTGAKPRVSPALQLSHPRIFYVRSMEHAIEIREFLQKNPIESVVIIGAGYIGLEMLESYLHFNIKKIYLIGHSLPLSGKMKEKIRTEIESKGIAFKYGVRAEKLEAIDESHLRLTIDDGTSIETEMVQISSGVVPDTDLFINTELKCDRGAIVVDKYQQTNIPDVYAAGDCVTAYHTILKSNAYIPLAPAANKQGRIAGTHLAGEHTEGFPGVVGTAIFKVLDLHIGITGINDEQAKKMGLNVDSIMIENNEIAHYYPGVKKMAILLRFDVTSHLLLGAEIIAPTPLGAKKIDVLATALSANMTIEDIQKLDLAYAPPFAPVWDPILIAADIAKKKLI
jgi:NADPH-dependent 2,4-dienoyl-CoA reductase/sulfur reductase-like enzyme